MHGAQAGAVGRAQHGVGRDFLDGIGHGNHGHGRGGAFEHTLGDVPHHRRRDQRPGRIVDEYHGVVVGDCLQACPHGIGALAAAVHEADGRGVCSAFSACGVDAADNPGGLGLHIWADQHNDLIDHAGGQQRAHGALQEGAPAQLDISLGHLSTEAGALAGGRDERDDARFSLRRRRRGHRDRCRCRYQW